MDPKAIIEKMQNVYKTTKTYEYNSVYSLFKGHKGTDVITSYDGLVYRNSEGLYQKIEGNEFVYGKNFFLRITKEEKTMELFQAQKMEEFNVNLDLALKHCSEVKAEKKEGYYEVVLLIKNNTSIPISVLKMRIDDSSYYLEQLDLYFTYSEDFSEDVNKKDLHQPHLQIKFSGFTKSPKTNKNIVKLDKYLIKSGSAYKLTESYKDYQFINNQKSKL
jgi:hypothetical protein